MYYRTKLNCNLTNYSVVIYTSNYMRKLCSVHARFTMEISTVVILLCILCRGYSIIDIFPVCNVRSY